MYGFVAISFILLTLILWAWAIIDILKNEFKEPSLKYIWLLLVFFFPIFGSIFYFQLKKKYVLQGR